MSSLANWYFRVRPIEMPVYRLLGVWRFKRWLMRLVGDKFAQKMGWRLEGRSNLKVFCKQTRRNEWPHLLVLVLLLGISLQLISTGDGLKALALLLINIPFNLYPLMLQRYNRYSLKQLLKRDEHIKD